MKPVTTSDRLPRTLGLWSSIALVLGITIGSGIFRSPAAVARHRVMGYPVVPAIFIVGVVWFVTNSLVTEPVSTGLTFAVILAGLPVYELCFSRAR